LIGIGFSFERPCFVAPKQLKPKNTKEVEEVMKKLVGILLIGLLSFLGCSDGDDRTSDDGTSAVMAEPVPIAPFGIIDTTTPTYEWTAVTGATRYLLMVVDTADMSAFWEWYTAEEAGCTSDDLLCMVTPDKEVIQNIWMVLACAGDVCGSGSAPLAVRKGVPPSERFIEYPGNTVRDRNTQLMWTRNANPSGAGRQMVDAYRYCENLVFPDPQYFVSYDDWTLPRRAELNSLIDESNKSCLPPGHPFIDFVSHVPYWTNDRYKHGKPIMPRYSTYVYECRKQLWFKREIKYYGVAWCVRRDDDK